MEVVKVLSLYDMIRFQAQVWECLVISGFARRQAAENAPDIAKALVSSKPVEETAEQTQPFPRVMLPSDEEIAEPSQRNALFQRVCMSRGEPCTLIIDSGSTRNLVARAMVEKLGLKRLKHPTPYRISWLQEGHELLVDEQCEVEFHIDEYMDKVICDITTMDVCDILLGRPWQFDRDVIHYGKKNHYKVYKDGIKHKLAPIKDEDTAGTSETRSQFLKQVESPKEKVTVTPPASESEAESGPAESEQVEKTKEESGPAAKEDEPAKEETVKPAEAAPAEEKAEVEGKGKAEE